jgi:hypothetical protein
MPKQLLRYALSKVDLLDSEALDIDNLDFNLGRNTVLEFRDAGINLKVSRSSHGPIRPGAPVYHVHLR